MFLPDGQSERHQLVHDMVDAGADLNKQDVQGSTALYLALLGGDLGKEFVVVSYAGCQPLRKACTCTF